MAAPIRLERVGIYTSLQLERYVKDVLGYSDLKLTRKQLCEHLNHVLRPIGNDDCQITPAFLVDMLDAMIAVRWPKPTVRYEDLDLSKVVAHLDDAQVGMSDGSWCWVKPRHDGLPGRPTWIEEFYANDHVPENPPQKHYFRSN